MNAKRLLAAAALASTSAALIAAPAMAQSDNIVPAIAATSTLLTVTAEGSSTASPDMASYSAGVTTEGTTASEALKANSAQMSKVMAALKRAGIADKDIQTSNLNLQPVYSQPRRMPDGSYEQSERTITGYQANNTVSVRQRDLDAMGKVLDALVSAGANQLNGPNFMLSEPEDAQDEARAQAMKSARERAALYAQASGLRVARIVSISESGGYVPRPVMYMKVARAEAAPAPPPPVAAGELETSVNLTVQFELAP